MMVFQVLLLALLALPLLAGRVGLLFLAIAYAVVLVASAYKAISFENRHKPAAVALLAFFAVLSLGVLVALLAGVSVLWIGAVAGVLMAVFFAFLAWRFSASECELIGWTNGFAVVRVPPSLVGVVKPGVYAVACRKKPAGKKVRVRFSFFKKEGNVEQ